MFSFHKPKIYRSNLGCCICKAKSSSSRFTDSNKYENEFERCFRIKERRAGEICNACVLLVKRWKKLSPENRSIKHWHHVVDARAGPGTKLTSGRRLTHHSASGGGASGSSANRAGSPQQNGSSSAGPASDSSSELSVLPLSSSQATNHQASSSSTNSIRRRGNSFTKARAIDTNVSTFSFGESLSTYRRNYMTPESSSLSTSGHSAAAAGTLSSSAGANAFASLTDLSKPQSALNSSAFESVIKRFRQRQQQQLLETQRRRLKKQERLLQRKQQQQNSRSQFECEPPEATGAQDGLMQMKMKCSGDEQMASKRIKRCSDSISSICVDGLKVSSFLDSSIWRKERICCGVIFRNLYDEVAIFPKLMKPCKCRAEGARENKLPQAGSVDAPGPMIEAPSEDQPPRRDLEGAEERLKSASPPPRINKSGSISSCDSNTSGTGSMEQPLDELPSASSGHRAKLEPANQPQSRPATLKVLPRRQTKLKAGEPRHNRSSIPTTRRQVRQRQQQQQQEGDGSKREPEAEHEEAKTSAGSETETNSTLSSYSCVSSRARSGSKASSSGRRGQQTQQQQQQPAQQNRAAPSQAKAHSPASIVSGSESSSEFSRSLLMDEDDDGLLLGTDSELGQAEVRLMVGAEEEEIESSTDDASSSAESMAAVVIY